MRQTWLNWKTLSPTCSMASIRSAGMVSGSGRLLPLPNNFLREHNCTNSGAFEIQRNGATRCHSTVPALHPWKALMSLLLGASRRDDLGWVSPNLWCVRIQLRVDRAVGVHMPRVTRIVVPAWSIRIFPCANGRRWVLFGTDQFQIIYDLIRYQFRTGTSARI